MSEEKSGGGPPYPLSIGKSKNGVLTGARTPTGLAIYRSENDEDDEDTLFSSVQSCTVCHEPLTFVNGVLACLMCAN